MTIQPSTTVGQIAIEHPQTVRILQRLKLDFCCGGKLPLEEACAKQGLSLSETIAALQEALVQRSATDVDWSKKTVEELIDHLLATHHVFTREEFERLDPLMTKVAKVHGDHHVELNKLKELFETLHDDLMPHMMKEEQILFPHMQETDRRIRANQRTETPFFGTVEAPVQMMLVEHEDAGELLRRMRDITNGYEIPFDACGSFRALYQGLVALEADLHLHIHLENNVLFPRAIEQEQKAATKVA